MSTTVAIESDTLQRANECVAHLLPCEIGFNGPAKVDEYFVSSIKHDNTQGLTCTLRGRPLDGEIKNVPSGYTGIIMKETHKAFTDEEERKMSITHKFSNFHYWNLDKKPSNDDKLQQVFTWMDIASVLHSPVEPSAADVKKKT